MMTRLNFLTENSSFVTAYRWRVRNVILKKIMNNELMNVISDQRRIVIEPEERVRIKVSEKFTEDRDVWDP